jgi:hypothetical protein
MPRPFKIEHLCYLPHNLARNDLVVRPCVAFLHADEPPSKEPSPLVEELMIPRLNAREVAAVFSAPFSNFLKATDNPPVDGTTLPEGHWYDGTWIHWQDEPWRAHSFYVPVNNQRVTKPTSAGRADGSNPQEKLAEQLEEEEEQTGRYRVWGMTARILVDCVTIAYGRTPDFEHNDHFGDEKIIEISEQEGRLYDKKSGAKANPNGNQTTSPGKAKAEPSKM